MKKLGFEILITSGGIVLVTSFVSASIETFRGGFPMYCRGEDKSRPQVYRDVDFN